MAAEGEREDVTEREEFEELLDPHFDGLYGYALRLTRNRADADDLLQEAVFKAFRGLRGFQRGTNFKAWMFRIVTNAFISRRRREARAPQVVDLESVADPEAGSLSEGLEEELADADTDWSLVYREHVEDEVKQAIEELPVDFRLPLLLSSLGGLRYQEIADALQVPIGTVMSRLFRARQRLRRSLRDYALARGLAVTADGGA